MTARVLDRVCVGSRLRRNIASLGIMNNDSVSILEREVAQPIYIYNQGQVMVSCVICQPLILANLFFCLCRTTFLNFAGFI